MSIDETPSELAPQHNHDFSNVQGLQVVAAHPGAAVEMVAEGWPEALKLELEARAARFHQSVDASIVLSDDGVIRWLGDPVARLVAGPDLLTPRVLILADTSLSDSARETVVARLDLWVAATTKRLLGPLAVLRTLEGETEPVRQLAAKIAESLGVLDREPLRNQIKALDQNSRAALRRHGVRFGAYYVYLPQSLKPAARALALQLWSLHAPDANGEELARTLLPLASSGRTSLPVSPAISKDGYRIAGFRPCGERVVRVDIVERLSDMIRVAFVSCLPSEAAPSPGPAFLVSGQMTSLTGCSGEAFASILRSLGYESFEIARSQLTPPQPAAPAKPVAEAPADPATTLADGTQTPEDAALAQEDGASRQEEEASAEDEGAPAPEDGAETQEEDSMADGGATEASVLAHSAKDAEEQAAGGDTAEVAIDIIQSPVDEPEDPQPPSAAPGEAAAVDDAATPALEPTVADMAAPEPAGAGAESESPKVKEMVVAWRFAHRQRPERPKRFRRIETQPGGAPRLWGSGSPPRSEGGERRPDGEDKQVSPPKRERFSRGNEKRRKPAPKQNIPPAPAQFESRRAPTVDPNSPFAKLLELRAALEKQGKN